MPRNVLITAGAGHIGQELLPLLQSLEETRVILPTTNASRLKASLPPHSEPQSNPATFIAEEGSLTDPAWFQGLLEKYEVETVFLCLTTEDELFTTLNCLDCMARSKTVKHLIYLSACYDFASTECAQWILRNCSSGHVLVKILTEQKLVYGNLPFSWSVIRPTLFFINDLRSKHSMIENSVYDEPLSEQGVSRVAPSDIALAIKNVIIDESGKWNGRHISIGSKKVYKGSEIADIWSKALGKRIEMYPATEEGFRRFETEMGSKKNSAWGRDMRLMVELFAKEPFGMTEKEYLEQVELLGKEPEDYEAWVQKTVTTANW